MNLILLSFFMIEIATRLFADPFEFMGECINMFDAIIVQVSFLMLVLRIEARILGILRILRLVKVVIEMKRVADESRER